ncbi:unnamed protein product [Prunus brigantina]
MELFFDRARVWYVKLKDRMGMHEGEEKRKHGIPRVIEEGVGEQTTSSGDDSGGKLLGRSGGDDPVDEDSRKRWVVGESRVGVDIDREMGFGGLVEEAFPERGEGKRGGGFGEFWGLGDLGEDGGGYGGGWACNGEYYGERQTEKNGANERKWRWGEHGFVVERKRETVTSIFSGKWRVRFGGRR